MAFIFTAPNRLFNKVEILVDTLFSQACAYVCVCVCGELAVFTIVDW